MEPNFHFSTKPRPGSKLKHIFKRLADHTKLIFLKLVGPGPNCQQQLSKVWQHETNIKNKLKMWRSEPEPFEQIPEFGGPPHNLKRLSNVWWFGAKLLNIS